MKRLAIGILMGMAICAAPVYALRMSAPPTFYDWNNNTFSQLNDVLLMLFNISNGRYQMDRVTVDPDSTRPCSVGEMVYFDTGTDQICVCASATTKTWNCANLT
jgi:hypothetical protein